MNFRDIAETAESVLESRGTHAKRDAVADLLRRAPAEDLPHAARFLSGTPFARVDARVLQVGWSVLQRATLSLLPEVDDLTLRACHRATGDGGETLALLAEAYPPRREAKQRTLFEATTDGAPAVAEVAEAFARIAAAPAASKANLLEAVWRRMSPLEMKYFTKIITGGMRIGLAESLVEEAIAKAFGRDVEDVRLANMLSGDVGETAALAREDRLQEARFRLFHPLGFMLASPVEEAPPDLDAWLVEDKFDGIRAQLHVGGGRAELYSRTLEAAREFPEVLEAARRLPHELVLDGEVIAVKPDGKVAPFALLQRRLGRKQVSAQLRAEVPVRYVAYDALFVDGEPLYGKPLEERRRTLESLPLRGALGVSPLVPADFEAARARGNEGLMFKRRGSAYELGKRGNAWLKLKRAFATLDVVVTAAELGHGKRAGLLSDVTFAVRGPGGELLNVGKAYTGLTNEEIRDMTSILKSITIERYASVHLVRPQIVLEVAFDSVTKSARHKSGYALRFPRIVRWRHDKPAGEIDTLARVEELWRLSGGAETLL